MPFLPTTTPLMLAATIVAFCGAAVDRVGAGPREL